MQAVAVPVPLSGGRRPAAIAVVHIVPFEDPAATGARLRSSAAAICASLGG